MYFVDCIDIHGQMRRLPKTDLIFRPAVFAIVVHDEQLLVLTLKATGKRHLPGGGVDLGDTLETTLKRELQEETGVEIEVGNLVYVAELFFYYNPSGKAYHGLHFYYSCRPKSVTLLADAQVQDGSAEKPRWVALNSLQADDFQNDGEMILAAARQGT